MISRLRLSAALAALVLTLGVPLVAAADDQIPVASSKAGDTLAVFYSGDGGWAALDRTVSQYLADNGVPTVGFNSLSYFTPRRSPAGATGTTSTAAAGRPRSRESARPRR